MEIKLEHSVFNVLTGIETVCIDPPFALILYKELCHLRGYAPHSRARLTIQMGGKNMGVKQHHYVLVHGGSHGAWCWVQIIPLLEKAGHRVSAVELVSAGESPVTADEVTSFWQYNQPLVDLFNTFTSDEKSNYPSLPPEYKISMFSEMDGGPSISMDVPPDSLIEHFYNKCSPEDGIFAFSRVRSCPLMSNVLISPTCTKQNYGSVPRILVLTLQDKALRPILAKKMLEQNPPSEVIEIDTYHSPFFCAPDVERSSRIQLPIFIYKRIPR